jgi:uncharacterized integral membrane protein
LRNFRIGLAVFALLVLVLLVAQNSETVLVRLLAWHVEMSLVALVFLTAGSGLILGFVLGRIGWGSKR